MSKQNFYELKLIEIKNLLANNKIDQVLKILDEELSLSYIPLEYEEIFSKLWIEINNQKKQQENLEKHLSSEQFIDYLFANDNKKLIKAISVIEEINLKPLKKILKKWIEDSKNDNWIAKVYMIEAMAAQEINIDLIYNQKLINPQKFGSIFEKTQVINIFHEINDQVHKKNYLKNFAFQNFKTFLLINYPNIQFSKNISKILIKITESMFNDQIKLTKQELIIFNQIKNF